MENQITDSAIIAVAGLIAVVSLLFLTITRFKWHVFLAVLTPILLNQLPGWLGIHMSTALISHLEFMIFGAMIVFFLIVEPHGLARLWAIAKEKLRLWPFPH